MSRFIILVIISFTTHISSKSDDNAVDFNFFDVEKIPENCNGWGQMKCWSGQCVSITNKCNGVQDCDDGSDEWSHFCRANFCEEDQFQCRYGACLPMKAKCNGKKECWDGTDEHEELCAIEIDTSLTSTTRIKTTAVTEGIVNPTIKATKKNKTAENANAPQTNTSVLDYSTHFEVIENSEKDLTTTSGVKTTRTQTTTNRPLVTTTKDTKTPFNALPTERPHLTTTSVKATISTQKTSASKPLLKPTTKANVTRNHSEKDLQITTPKIRKTTKYSATLTTPTFSIDVPSETPSTQPKSNGNKGQEVRKIHNKLAVSQTTLSTPNVASQTTIFKTNLSSTPNYASVSNVSVQISINSQPQTDVLPNSPLYYVNKALNTTETLRNLNYPGSITTTLSNRYNIKKTTPPSTTTKGTPKAIKLCILRNCGHPLFCNISLPGSLDSKSSHANQGRLYLMEGSQVIFNCADGYVLEGVNRTTCTAKGWSNENPSCNPHCDVDFKSNCASPLKCFLEEPNIRSKTVIRNNFAETKVKEHSQLSFVCDDGYLLEGPKLRKCTTKGWSNVMPRCVNRCDVLDLGIPKSPLMCQLFDSNTGLSHYYQYSQRNRMIKEGSYLEYSCEYGYKLNGANRSTCTNNGWNSDAPTCKQTCDAGILNACTSPLNCERFDFAINNYRRIYKGSVQQLSQLEYLHLSCDDGYDLQGTQYLTCMGGKWQGTMPKCNERISNTCDKRILDNCTYPLICKRFDREFNDFRKINSATRQKSVSDVERIKVSCGYGYVLDGRNVLSCAAGKWDHNMPKCIASSCRFDLIPRCKHPLTCTWYDSKSQSEQITTDNNITESTSYALNTQIVFGCANGYKLKGEEQTICTSNGWTHEQSLKLPECTLQCDTDIFKSCKEPLVCFYLQPNKKFLQVSSDFLIEDVENSFIYFRCVNDYMLQGVDYINCNSKGWDNPMPECVSAYS
ncbi:uncharacterized protein [Bactrocera oleae]|uniref:uncharacterized protein isoform X2 n=1 Tax=Bactrocera oleae TaxID=104688 RepID=UPI00387E3CEB